MCIQSIESGNVESIAPFKDEAGNYLDVSWNGRNLNPKFNESTVETVRNAILNYHSVCEQKKERSLEGDQFSATTCYWTGAELTVVKSGQLESINITQENGYIPCGGRCHTDYSLDLDVNKEGVDAELDVDVESEDGNTSFSAGADAHVDYEGNTEYSGHINFTYSF